MTTGLKAIILDDRDNVATALSSLGEGQDVHLEGAGQSSNLRAVQPIPLCHKLALRDIKAGEPIMKYGVVIGEATATIAAGEHVHVHNVRSRRGQKADR